MVKPIHKPTIIRDTREKDGKGWQFNASANIIGTETVGIPTGDYTIKGLEGIFIVERKASASEIYQNLASEDWNRFKDELDRLSKIPYRYIFIECSINDICEFPTVLKKMHKYTKVTPQFVLSRLSEIEFRYKIPIHFLGSTKGEDNWNSAKEYLNRFFCKFYNLYMNGELDVKPNTI